jgi:3-dehydroquinate synthase
VLRCLAEMGFPLGHPILEEREQLFAGMEEFRQHLGGELTLTMLRGVGEPIDVHEVDRAAMADAIDAVQAFARDHCGEGPDDAALPMHDALCKRHCQ